jgi:hypothetical protein
MIRTMLFIGMTLIFSANSALADLSLMAGKHIFTPDNIGETKEEAPSAPEIISGALEKEILFTGVLISPKGKFAILKENATNDKTGQKHVLRQGDQIKGMTIQEIGSNFVLLAGKENTTVKMNLYKGAKLRPAPVPVETKPESAPGANVPHAPQAAPQAETTPDAQSQGASAEEKEPQGPFGGKGKTAQQQSGDPQANPFADVFNRAGSRRNQRGGSTNPFNNMLKNQ